MFVIRPLLIAVLGAAPTWQALAAQRVPVNPRDDKIVVDVARKGTRNYAPVGGAADAASEGTAAKDDNGAALEQCMRTWDDKTHITKSKWREICLRQLKDRASMYR